MKNILCIGAGYVGGPTMAVIAKHCPEYRVEVVDINAERIAAWQTDRLPIYEPGLLETIQLARGRNLFFYSDVEERIDRADIIFVSVNTPTKTFGQGAGRAADLQYWEQTARLIARRSTRPKIVVEKSTLPVRTAEAMEAILSGGRRQGPFRGGLQPGVPGRGERDPRPGEAGPRADRRALRRRPAARRRRRSRKSTRTGCRASASSRPTSGRANWPSSRRTPFLAQRVCSINAIAALCERTGANIAEVSRAVGMDHRIGPEFLRAGTRLRRLLLPQGHPPPGLPLRNPTACPRRRATGKRCSG